MLKPPDNQDSSENQPLTRLVFVLAEKAFQARRQRPKRRTGLGYNRYRSPMSPMTRFSSRQVRAFRKRLLSWFDREQRKLPWRGERDPYRILVSEIMLQQTRVAVVEERYKVFLRQFPTITKLARAREQSVLAAWSGLGYYRRARALHATAKMVVKNGGFPHTASGLMELPGVGRYTGAAVASIAFGEPVPVVDGNVKRVLGRLCGRDLKDEQNWAVAGELVDRGRSGDFNQAMMELGAVICVPGNPRCEQCPVASLCVGRGVMQRRQRSIRRKAVLRYKLTQKDGRVLLRQRPQYASLMAGMWELPECSAGNRAKPMLKLRHSITTTDYSVLVYAAESTEEGRWVHVRAAERMALTGLARKILAVAFRAQ